jgi:hypothetical protein
VLIQSTAAIGSRTQIAKRPQPDKGPSAVLAWMRNSLFCQKRPFSQGRSGQFLTTRLGTGCIIQRSLYERDSLRDGTLSAIIDRHCGKTDKMADNKNYG